jgi:hypothetical protein
MSLMKYLSLLLWVVTAQADRTVFCFSETGESWLQGNLTVKADPDWNDGTLDAALVANVSLKNKLGDEFYSGPLDLIGIFEPAGPMKVAPFTWLPQRFFNGDIPTPTTLPNGQHVMSFLYFAHTPHSSLFTLGEGTPDETSSEDLECDLN